jgi:hypothetical protein
MKVLATSKSVWTVEGAISKTRPCDVITDY